MTQKKVNRYNSCSSDLIALGLFYNKSIMSEFTVQHHKLLNIEIPSNQTKRTMKTQNKKKQDNYLK